MFIKENKQGMSVKSFRMFVLISKKSFDNDCNFVNEIAEIVCHVPNTFDHRLFSRKETTSYSVLNVDSTEVSME